MATEIRLPQWGMGMQEGTVTRWLKSVGDRVSAGEEIVDVEAAKTNAGVESPLDGVLLRIDVEAGATVPVRSVIALVGDADELGPAAPPPGTVSRRVPATPYARRLARERVLSLSEVPPDPDGRVRGATVLAHCAGPDAPTDAAPAAASASPLARKVAARLGVDLDAVRGSGPRGRIVADDVRWHAENGPAQVRAAPAPDEEIPISGMRRTIAHRMRSSLAESAQLTLTASAAADQADGLRVRLVEAWIPDGVRPSWTDLVAAALVRAAVRHPAANATWADSAIIRHGAVNLGVAVAVPGGLVVPVVRNAQDLTLRELSRERARLAERARAGDLDPDEMTGGTLTLTSLGRGPVTWFTPILNPGESVILGVGALIDGLGWDGDRPLRTRTLPLSLTVDHRVIDGAPGAEFLSTVVGLLEQPEHLLS